MSGNLEAQFIYFSAPSIRAMLLGHPDRISQPYAHHLDIARASQQHQNLINTSLSPMLGIAITDTLTRSGKSHRHVNLHQMEWLDTLYA